MVQVQFELINGGKLPEYQHTGDSGMDAYANCEYGCVQAIMPGQRMLIPLGIKAAVPIGYEIQVRPKSGLAINKGITILNTPGTIDAGYRSQISAIVINTSKEVFYVEPMSKICQLVVAPVIRAEIVQVDHLSTDTERGTGGFGSTGLK